MLENINIFSLGGFTFFLLILSVGYYVVEIIGGKNYWYRRVFENYSNNLFDRLMHYITWGLLVNVCIVYWFIKSDGVNNLINILNTSGEIADAIGGNDTNSIQIIIFVCFYYMSIFSVLVMANGMIWIFGILEKISVLIVEGEKEEQLEIIEEEPKSIVTTEIIA